MSRKSFEVKPRAAGADIQLDDLIQTALAHKPDLCVPETFAARVAQLAVAQQPVGRRQWLGWGPLAAVGSGVLLTTGMFAMAPHAAPSLSNTWFDGELILLLELSGLLLFSGRLLSRD